MSFDDATLVRLRTQIDTADVSETAKEFYREHLDGFITYGGWSDEQYVLIRELDRAGLVMTRLEYVERDSANTAD